MFVGVLSDSGAEVSDLSMNLVSIILFNCAHALENSALYKKVNEYNKHLEEAIEKRTLELRHALKEAQVANVAKRHFVAISLVFDHELALRNDRVDVPQSMNDHVAHDVVLAQILDFDDATHNATLL